MDGGSRYVFIHTSKIWLSLSRFQLNSCCSISLLSHSYTEFHPVDQRWEGRADGCGTHVRSRFLYFYFFTYRLPKIKHRSIDIAVQVFYDLWKWIDLLISERKCRKVSNLVTNVCGWGLKMHFFKFTTSADYSDTVL
jgi:hypothetical protein